MKMLIRWQLHEGKLHDVLSMFSKMTPAEDREMMGSKMEMIGRWHDLSSGTGVAIMECSDAAAMSAYALQWNKHMDLEVSVVVDDEEARAIGATLG